MTLHNTRLLFRKALCAPIWLYKACISPFCPPSCRFYPTCSTYAKEAIIKYGALKGGYLALKRLCKCHPWCRCNPHDPVP